MIPMIRHHVMQYNVRWLRLVRSCIMSCSWSDAAAALIILFSREREKQGEGGREGRGARGWMRKGSNRGSIEDGPGRGQAGGPRVHRPKTRGRNQHGEGGGAAFWVGRGKRGRVWSPERGKKKVWVREGELTGDLPGWHKGRWISRLSPWVLPPAWF